MRKYDLHPAKHITQELFPCLVVKNFETQGNDFKIYITDVALTIWREEGGNPVLIDEVIWDTVEGNRKDGLTVYADDNVYHLVREENCGCGSRLRGFHPYPGVPRIASR